MFGCHRAALEKTCRLFGIHRARTHNHSTYQNQCHLKELAIMIVHYRLHFPKAPYPVADWHGAAQPLQLQRRNRNLETSFRTLNQLNPQQNQNHHCPHWPPRRLSSDAWNLRRATRTPPPQLQKSIVVTVPRKIFCIIANWVIKPTRNPRTPHYRHLAGEHRLAQSCATKFGQDLNHKLSHELLPVQQWGRQCSVALWWGWPPHCLACHRIHDVPSLARP